MTAGPTASRSSRDGRILVADYRHGIMELDAQAGRMQTILTARNSESFKGCNDLHLASNGDIYFTDQGQTGLHDPTGRVYRLAAGGRLDCLIDTGISPNGLVLDPARGRAVRGDDPRQRGVADAVHEGRQRLQGRPLLLDVRAERPRRHDHGQRGPAVRRACLAGPCLRVRAEWRIDRADQILRRPSCTNVAIGGDNRDRLYITELVTGTVLVADIGVLDSWRAKVNVPAGQRDQVRLRSRTAGFRRMRQS